MRGSPLPLLPIGALSQAGFFHAKGYKRIMLPGLSAEGMYSFSKKAVWLNITIPSGTIEVELGVISQAIRFGHRPYFVCPYCDKFVNEIVIAHDTICCVTDYYNLDCDLSKLHRRSLVLEAREILRASRKAALDALADQPKPRYAERTRFREGLSLASSHNPAKKTLGTRSDLTTNYALRWGRGADLYELYFEYLRFSPDYWRTKGGPRAHTTPPTFASIYDAPVLDVGELLRALQFIKDKVRVKILGWDREIIDGFRPWILADARDSEPFFMVSNYCYDHKDLCWQYIELRRRANGRVHFVCPVTGKLCDRLYWRGGIFATWQAQRLYHPSQRGEGRKRTRSAS